MSKKEQVMNTITAQVGEPTPLPEELTQPDAQAPLERRKQDV